MLVCNLPSIFFVKAFTKIKSINYGWFTETLYDVLEVGAEGPLLCIMYIGIHASHLIMLNSADAPFLQGPSLMSKPAPLHQTMVATSLMMVEKSVGKKV